MLQFLIGKKEKTFDKLIWGVKFSLTDFSSNFFIEAKRLELSAFLEPITIIASPLSAANFLKKRSAGLIFIRSVHHLNLRRGAGYPLPIKLTQNVSLMLGVSKFGKIGNPCSFALASSECSEPLTQLETIGFSTKVSVVIT